jgi:hypothetical protein
MGICPASKVPSPLPIKIVTSLEIVLAAATSIINAIQKSTANRA